MRKIKIHYIEKIELTEEHEIEDEDFNLLESDRWSIFDVTNIAEDAESFGDNWIECEAFDENGKEIWSF